jgi:tRNA pseudouridine13 synthase
MKLKQLPEDFQVEELTDIVPGEHGSFTLYRLTKRGWTTPDALAAIRRRWKLQPNRLSYGGLKDRHAQTIQYLTIFRGPERHLTHHDIRLDHLGKVAVPYTSKDIRANRFQLTLRDLNGAALERALPALEEIRGNGVPNYFDDQRFGSVGDPPNFIARLIVQGDYEAALKLALAAPYAFDRPAQKKEKNILKSCWGDWAKLKEKLPRSHARSLVDFLLQHPGDFKGALERLRPELRGLYLSAYQSYLWNRMLARWLTAHCRPEQLRTIKLKLGEVPIHRQLDEAQRKELAALNLPLPSARLKVASELVEAVLAEEGITLDQMKLRGFKEMFFSKGDRPALCLPENMHHETQTDEINPGKKKLILSFDLPRGAYATLIVKRITTV